MLFSWSRTPDAVFRLAAASQLVAIQRAPGLLPIALHPIVRLEGLRCAAVCAQHCAQIAQRKSSKLCAALHTDCATEELQAMRVIAHRLRNGSAAHCARHCTRARRRECADCARHCEQVAQRKCCASCAAVRTVCAQHCARLRISLRRGFCTGLRTDLHDRDRRLNEGDCAA